MALPLNRALHLRQTQIMTKRRSFLCRSRLPHSRLETRDYTKASTSTPVRSFKVPCQPSPKYLNPDTEVRMQILRTLTPYRLQHSHRIAYPNLRQPPTFYVLCIRSLLSSASISGSQLHRQRLHLALHPLPLILLMNRHDLVQCPWRLAWGLSPVQYDPGI